MENAESGSGEVFDVERILQLVELMKEHELSEIDLRQARQRIRLRRGSSVQWSPAMMPAPPAAEAAKPAQPAEPAAPKSDENVVIMKSPMVGTFYSKPNPKANDFVKVGDYVEAESTVVCIIEAMKVFNEIPAEVSGRIVAVLVENEEPVEFGKPLFKIETGK